MTAAIQKSQPSALDGFNPTNLPQAIAFAEMLGKSGLVPRAIAGKPSDILVVLLTGHEFGLGPMASLRLISVIEGKPVIGGEAYLAIVQSSPQCEYFRCTETSEKKATFEAKRRGEPKAQTLTWTIEQAARAGLLGKDNWKRYPESMLRWRCVSALAKIAFAAEFSGVYEADEQDEIGATAANTVDGVALPADARPTTEKLAERLKAGDGVRPGVAERPASQATVTVASDKSREVKADPREIEALQRLEDALGPDLAKAVAAETMPEGTNPLAPDKPKTRPSPNELWTTAGGDQERFKALMTEHGHLVKADDVKKPPEKLPHQVADDKKAADAAQGPLMLFGPHKTKPISGLTGPELLEQIVFGESKIGGLDATKAAKVRACIEAIKAEQKRRDDALLEPGSDIDVD